MSPQERWIAVVGWDRLTHSDAIRGSGDTLPWHRTYASLLDDDGYWNLPAGTRGVYRDILLVALRSAGRVPEDTLTLTRKIGVKVSKRQLEALNQAGLIGFCASAEQAERLHAASPRVAREELERESEKELSQVEPVVRQPARPDLVSTESDTQHKDEAEDEQPFAREPEPELPKLNAGFDLPTIEQRPNVEPDDSMQRLGESLDPEDLVQRWSGETA